MSPARRFTVCSARDCPELVTPTDPCPKHGRPLNASWSPQRDRTSHHKLRAVVVKARGPKCERCGKPGEDSRGKALHLHHVRPEDTPEAVILLCRECHKAVDRSAR